MKMVSETEWLRMPWDARQRHLAALTAEKRRIEDALSLVTEDVVRHSDRINHLDLKVPEHRARWTPPMLKLAHAAHTRGARDEFAVIGEREYQRRRKASQRGAA